ncbi:hypothetical protein C0Q70_11934 [Pomacea canaliculata]|uniref:Uncharacterized protein n=1 Tax=Pomacea canaliculata TaxID=400727 RepID=A0A2T7P7G6_POMCA|nr:hypothetical protein C0Q70_11934 [Pomacea canaliculata]
MSECSSDGVAQSGCHYCFQTGSYNGQVAMSGVIPTKCSCKSSSQLHQLHQLQDITTEENVSTPVYLRVGAVEPFSTHTLSRLLRAFTQEATDRYHPDISNGFLSRFCFEKQPQVTPSSPPPPVRHNKGAMASPARLPSPVCVRASLAPPTPPHLSMGWRER